MLRRVAERIRRRRAGCLNRSAGRVQALPAMSFARPRTKAADVLGTFCSAAESYELWDQPLT
jgi:hypothetical protein